MQRWTLEEAQNWYAKLPWLTGCNFIPSNAINQLEMWQAETFDPVTIDRELGYAQQLGLNLLRVYLHDLVWENDPKGFFDRIDRFLDIARSHGQKVMLTVFDDCWNTEPKIGRQPEPVPGVHNSGWVQSPGKAKVKDPSAWPVLERYLKALLERFGQDDRVLIWDLYNEPGNNKQDEASLPLLCQVFHWARQVKPSQPLTCGLWYANPSLNAFQVEASDIISFHNYFEPANLQAQINSLRAYGRPLICSEWLRRGHSDVATFLPIFHRERVACCHWGLVRGKTQTIFPWGSKPEADEPADVEPGGWFHDLLHADGAAYRPKEAELFKQLRAANDQAGW